MEARLDRWPGVLLLAVAAGSVGPAAAAVDAPRPLSAAERAGVELAGAYLVGGAEAWAGRLAGGSPLGALDPAAARAEIEVRAGAPAGARWELRAAPAGGETAVFAVEYASGVDETLTLDLAEEGGEWRISALRILGEEPPRKAGERGATTARPATGRGLAVAILLLVGAALAATAGAARPAAARRRALAAGRRLPSLPTVAAGGAAVAGGAVLAAAGMLAACGWPGRWGGDDGAVVAAPPWHELRSLLPLRRDLTAAGGPGLAGDPPAGADPAARLARLWAAQYLIERRELNRAEDLLGPPPVVPEVPLAELLRARLGFARLAEVETALAYERLLSLGAAHEGHLFEAALGFAILGFDGRARRYLDEAAAAGARDARVYYALAELEARDGRLAPARRRFEQGWRLEPREREDLLRDPRVAPLLADPAVRDLLALGSPEEPTVGCPAAAGRPLAPGAAEARLLGQRLLLSHGDGEIRVPGGCDIAPAGAAVDDAAGWARRREGRALDRLAELSAAVRAAGAGAASRLLGETGEAAVALARRHRWAELIELTGGLSAEPARMPPRLARLRAEALRREDRDREARDLLVAQLRGSVAEGRADPATLYQLAEVLAAEGSFDAALKVVARADSQLPFPPSGDRERRVRLERRLATDYPSRRTPHFDLRHRADWDRHDVARAARVLEAERARLRRWIPVDSDERVEIHFLPATDYVNAIDGGMGTVGLFDGKIRVPFAEVPTAHPVVVAVISHELAHAMISQATDDRAPRWLQEGLAQHVQMIQGRINPIPGYVAMSRHIAFPLLDAALEGLSLPELQAVAYDEANWTVHYIESDHGVDALHRLLAAFRDGATTEEALRTVFGASPAEFDRAVRRWATARAPEVWPVELVRYDEDEPPAADDAGEVELSEDEFEALKQAIEEELRRLRDGGEADEAEEDEGGG
jgi:hypothetical protein